MIELNGFIALPDTKFFKALPEKMDRFFSASGSASYLLSNYKSPKKEKNYKVASLEFDLNSAYLNNNYYSFVISVPGLELTEGGENYLGIKEIKIEVEGRSLGEKIISFIKK